MASTPSRLTSDNTEQLRVTGGGGGGGAVNITGINGSPPALSNPLPVELSDGTNPFGTPSNPIHIDNVWWGGVAVQAAQTGSTDGTGANPVIRNIPRYFGQVLTTTPLGANGTYVSPWFDRNQTGDYFVYITLRADQASAASAVSIFEADDTADANFQFNVTGASGNNYGTSITLAANTTTIVFSSPKRRFWQFRFQNGATPQGSFKVIANGTPYQINTSIGTQSSSTLASTYVALTAPVPGTTMVGDGNAIGSITAFANMASFNLIASYGASNIWQYQRTPAIFKTASIAATATGNTAAWTPTAGKKFRLMRFQITAQGLAATATGVVTVSFQDNVTGITIGTYDVDVPAVAGVVSGVQNISGGWIDLGNGFLSAAANNVLNFNISAAGAGTVGTYRVNVCGTEE